MSVLKFRARVVLPALIVVAAGAVVLVPVIRDRTEKAAGTSLVLNPTKTSSAYKKTTGKVTDQDTYVATTDFKYLLPTGWAKISPTDLQSAGAVSGIATVTIPITQFRIAIEPADSSPADISSLASQTLVAIKQFQNFALVSNDLIKVSGQDGQQYIYKLGYDNETEQQLTVLLYKGRAFSLLFTGPITNFAKQQAVIDNIVSSFTLL